MSRLVRALLAARADHTARVRAAFAVAFDALGHPGFAVSLGNAVSTVAVHMKEPWSRGLEREVLQASQAAGARLVVVGKRRLLVGLRVCGQTVAEAVEAGRQARAEATGARGRRGPERGT